MSDVLRSTTFQLAFNGKDGITGVRTFTSSVRDADAAVAKLNEILGENATVTVKNVKSKAELARQAQQVVKEFERSAKQTEALTRHYTQLAANIDKTSDELEQLNAVARLGANASEAQKKQVLDSVIAYQQLRDKTDGAGGSMHNFRGVAQNLGWQMQDTVVQLQMGTSAFMVLSQQGSQFASAFGPTGAVIGAVIAVAGVVGGTLFTSLMNSKTAIEKLDAVTKEYEKYLTVTAEGVTKLSDAFNELGHYSKIAAEEQLKLSRLKVLEGQTQSLQVIAKTIDDIDAKGRGLKYALGLETFENISFFRQSLIDLKKEVNQVSLDNFAKSIAMINPESKTAIKGLEPLKQALLDQFLVLARGEEILKDSAKGYKPLTKAAVESVDEIVKAFESEYNALTKQTETVDQEYSRRKEIIDAYVLHIGTANEKAKEAYANLDLWKAQQLDKEFQTFYKNLVKKTNNTDQEYERQKAIIDDHVKRVGSVDTQAAEAYVDLEKWKTDQYQKEYDKRERVRREIERAQIKVRKGDDPIGAETDVFASNMQKLTEQRNALAADQVKERERINALMEGEMDRHTSVMAKLELEQAQGQVAIVMMAAQHLTSLADLMAGGANDVKEKVAQMNDFQKAMFIVSQVLAASMAFIDGISMGMKLAAIFPLVGPEMLALGTAMGSATAGAIMGVTIAGAFDKGGNIPTGQAGIVSEYGDELVNGVLVKGPARVTSREDTAKLMNQGGGVSAVSLKVNVENSIPNASFEVQQISAEEVKIIATQVFNKNIDKGVSGVLSNRNSKATKSMKQNFTTGSKV